MKTGIMGIGLMGRAFVARLAGQGTELCIYNRDPQKIADLAAPDIDICKTPAELIDKSDTIILMASDAAAISDLLPLDSHSPLHGKTILQMATIAPEQSREICTTVTRCGGRYLEAPVLGSIPEASTGSLIIMAGGDPEVFDAALPTLKQLGHEPRYIGDIGSAAALKLAMNQLIAALTAGFSLSLAYALRNGVSADLFMGTVRESALYAKTYDKKLDKYLSGDFGTANFSTRHLLKDIRLFIEDAHEKGLNTDALEGIERITAQAVDSGLSLMDYSSIYRIIDPE